MEDVEIKPSVFKRLKAEKKKHDKRCSWDAGYERGYKAAQKMPYDELVQLTRERWFETEAGSKWMEICRGKFIIYAGDAPEEVDSCFTDGWFEGVWAFCNKLEDQL